MLPRYLLVVVAFAVALALATCKKPQQTKASGEAKTEKLEAQVKHLEAQLAAKEPPEASQSRLPSPPAKDPVAELKEKVSHLSRPREDILYIDISYDVRKSNSILAPITAIISGKEHILDHETQKTAYVLEFQLTAAYREGAWTFQHLSGNVLRMGDLDRLNIDEDEHNAHFSSDLIYTLGLKSNLL